MARAELLTRLVEFERIPDAAVIDSGVPLPRAATVEVTGPYRIRARFVEGSEVDSDLEGFVYKSRHFARLRDPAVFARLELVHEGMALRFDGDEELELGTDMILALAERQRPMTGQDFDAWMDRHGLSVTTAADVLGLARRTVQNYKKREHVPSLVAVACRAFDADRALLAALYHPRGPGRRRVNPHASAHSRTRPLQPGPKRRESRPD
jgi:Protein of unknown function (DUF2442)